MTQAGLPFQDLFERTTSGENPIRALRDFLTRESGNRVARAVNDLRFVGYVLSIGFDSARIITSDPYKVAVGGVPRGSFLIMVPTGRKPEGTDGLPLHFSLLRVTGVATTPLDGQVQQTYFELHKKSMPELDVWTQGELQWGALDCDVLGMFYADPEDNTRVAYSGDVNNVVSAHRYEIFAPDGPLLDLIVNGTVPGARRSELGELRTMECRLPAFGPAAGRAGPAPTPVHVSMTDFTGRRTAMFGKTRLGKSNVVKLLAQGMLDATDSVAADGGPTVGQLIFDLNGEYANDNPQDGDRSLRSANAGRCKVYALVKRDDTPSRPLRLNFYTQPDTCMAVLRGLLERDGRKSIYISAFASVEVPGLEQAANLPGMGDRVRAVRRIQMYWAILHRAGYGADESALRKLGLSAGKHTRIFNPGFSADDRAAVGRGGESPPTDLESLAAELEAFGDHLRDNPREPLTSGSGKPLFAPEDQALLRFLAPAPGSAGPSLLAKYKNLHSAAAGDFTAEILKLLDAGKTAILDLGNATKEIRQYFSDLLSDAVFAHQETRFVENRLAGHFVQLYFEEAHNLFPANERDLTGVYARFAKEGAKFHLGMVYSTQSPSTVSRDLLDQTENFFVGHLSSPDEAGVLAKRQSAFAGVADDIVRSRTPGFMRMLTQSHRFVVPVQARKYEPGAAGPLGEGAA